jgi:hypothetical protein
VLSGGAEFGEGLEDWVGGRHGRAVQGSEGAEGLSTQRKSLHRTNGSDRGDWAEVVGNGSKYKKLRAVLGLLKGKGGDRQRVGNTNPKEEPEAACESRMEDWRQGGCGSVLGT